jgi:hypothetical protein
MATIRQHDATARDIGGTTALQQVGQFVTIRTSGARELFEQLDKLAGSITADAFLKRAVRTASQIIRDGYKDEASKHVATGNLAASVTTFSRVYKNSNGSRAAIDVVGPRQTGNVGSQKGKESGNHAWLLEFGSGPRRPGTEGRRTYVNVHQSINRKMQLHPGKSMNDKQFANAGAGYYFLMGSMRERGPGSSYSRDFAGPGPGGDGRPQHPITLKPGETIAPMPALHLMQDTITAHHRDVLRSLENSLSAELRKYQ